MSAALQLATLVVGRVFFGIEFLTCVIASPHLALEVLPSLARNASNKCDLLPYLIFLDTQVEVVFSSDCVWRSDNDSSLDCLE